MHIFNQRHKVFISYHHENDQRYRNTFEKLFVNHFDIMVSKSVSIGDIHPDNDTEYIRQKIRDQYIADATVIIVLIGQQTWQRKYVDWEIYSGLRDTKNNPRCGLLGIFLPSYTNGFYPYTIPPRLYDNFDKYAKLYNWSDNPSKVSSWIDEAFKNRNQLNPKNNRKLFSQNRSGDRWYN